MNSQINIPSSEIKFSFIRSPGPGGQNVNKLATGVQIRFNVLRSPSLSEMLRLRFLALYGNKLTSKGELIIKATRFRTQERNKQDALLRLFEMLKRAAVIPKKRHKTKPSLAMKEQRLAKKKQQSSKKWLRRKPNRED